MTTGFLFGIDPEPAAKVDVLLDAILALCADGFTWQELLDRFEADHGFEELHRAVQKLQAGGRIAWSGRHRITRFGDKATVWIESSVGGEKPPA